MLDAWDNLPLEVLERGRMKHAVLPATTNPSVPASPVNLPPVPPDLDNLLTTLESLDLENDPTETGEGQDHNNENKDGQDVMSLDDSSSESSEIGGGEPPEICVRCSDVMEPKCRVQCQFCKIWLHPRCMSVNSQGKCAFCA